MPDIEITETITVEREVIPIHIVVKRIVGGFEVSLKSEPIEGFFRELSGGNVVNSPWEGIQLYNLPANKIPNIQYVHFALPGTQLFQGGAGSTLNATPLRAVGLGNGITIRESVGQAPPNNNHGRSLGVAFRNVGKDLYLRYIAPFYMEITVTSRERVVE